MPAEKKSAEDEPKTAKFKLRMGYGQHVHNHEIVDPGSEVDFEHYNPRWADKFEAVDDDAKKLKGAALALSRTVRMSGLDAAVEQAGGEAAVLGQNQLQEEAGMALTSGSAMEGRGVGDRRGQSGTPVSTGGSPVPLAGGHPLDHQTAAVRGQPEEQDAGAKSKKATAESSTTSASTESAAAPYARRRE